MRLLIPAVQYVRPDGRRNEGAIEVDASEWPGQRVQDLYVKLGELRDRGVEITLEMMIPEDVPAESVVAICLDDGDHDFKTEHVKNEAVRETVLALVEGFDPEEYSRSRSARELEPREPGPDDVAALVAHDAAVNPFAAGGEEQE